MKLFNFLIAVAAIGALVVSILTYCDNQKLNRWKKEFEEEYSNHIKKLEAVRRRDERVDFKGFLTKVSDDYVLRVLYIKTKETRTPKNIEVRIFPLLFCTVESNRLNLKQLKRLKAFILFSGSPWENRQIVIENILNLIRTNHNVAEVLSSANHVFIGVFLEISYNGNIGLTPIMSVIPVPVSY